MVPAARTLRGWPAVFLAINLAGIFWIHHSLTGGAAPKLRVLSALPARDVDRADRFSLLFDEPVVTASAIGSDVANAPFNVHPMVPGRWQWTAPDRLEYLLDAPLPPGRRFVVKPAPTLERLTGRHLVGQGEFEFRTRPLRVQRCEIAGADATHVTLDFVFNQPVAPSDLLAHLKLADDRGEALAHVQCLVQDPGDKLTVRADRRPSPTLQVHIAPELKGVRAELPLGKAYQATLEPQPQFAMLKAEPVNESVREALAVHLRASQPVASDQRVPTVRLEPRVADLQTFLEYGGLRLEGSFQCGVTYTATVSGDFLSSQREALGADQPVTFTMPDREPDVAFACREGVLSPTGNLLVDLKAVNVAGLNLRASRVHANNLIAHLRGDGPTAVARELPLKTIKLSGRQNEVESLALDLRAMLGEPLGIYCINASATGESWQRDSAVVAVTDLGLCAKSGRDGCLVWVTSIATARPIAGVEVSGLSYNNQVLARATSDERGLARLNVPPNHPDGALYAVVASRGNDLSYLLPESNSWRLDDVNVSGRPVPETYDVLMYTERGVYRPGDTVHLTGIVRDAFGATPPAFPLSVSVHRPDGREVAELKATPAADREGIFQLEYVTRDDGQLGPYAFVAHLPGDTKPLGRAGALVEEFVPVRLEVKAEPTSAQFGVADAVRVAVRSRYLFDQPGAGLGAQLTGRFEPAPFTSKKYADYSFESGVVAVGKGFEKVETTLDEAGHAELEVTPPEGLAPGLWRLQLAATIRQEGGRSVSTHVTCMKDLAGRYVGVRVGAGQIVPVAQPVQVDWVQLLATDAPADPGAMSWTLQRVETLTHWQEIEGRYVWKSSEQTPLVSSGEIAATATTSSGRFPVICPSPGRYRLTLTDCLSTRPTRVEFDAVAGADLPGAMAARPSRLELTFDRASYTAGSTAQLLIRSPFPGTLLLTVEGDRIHTQRVIEMPGTESRVDLTVESTWRGGAFVSATLVRPLDAKSVSWSPQAARGLARLKIDYPASHLAVRIDGPDRAEPGEAVTLRVHTQRSDGAPAGGVVHLWAVDEGILATTGYQTPEPAGYFLADRRLEVKASDLFDALLPDYQRPASMTRIGGDGDGEKDGGEAVLRSLVSAPRLSAAIVWREMVPLSADGVATVSASLPPLTGELRWMAVAVSGDSYGSTQRAMTVTAPLLVEMSAPRFAAPGDEFLVPAKVFNTTTSPMDVQLTWSVDGPVKIAPAEGGDRVTVAPGAPVVTWWRATAGDDFAPVSLRVAASARLGDRALHAESAAPLSVRPAGPLHTEVELKSVSAGEAVSFSPPDLFIPGTTRQRVTIGASPNIELLPAIEQLMDYPYGCVEQTTSELLVLLYAPDLLRATSVARSDAAAGMIRAGIARLWSMQTSSGGLSYWPGERDPNLWGTTYAANWLIDAKGQGYPVDDRLLSGVGKYLKEAMDARGDDAPDDDLRADICCVLSRLGSPPQGWLARLSERASELDLGARAQLASAWLAAGRKDRALDVLPKDGSAASSATTTTSERLTSCVREESLLLSVLLELDRGHALIPHLVRRLEQARKHGAWGSTLDNASAIAALARYQLQQGEPPNFQGVVRVGALPQRPFSSGAMETIDAHHGGGAVAVESSGKGRISMCVSTTGLLRDAGAVDYDRGLRVSRRWLDRAGRPIDPQRVRVGDLVRVETTLSAPGVKDDSIDNIAIVDALPAGFEIENPKLITSEQGGEDAGAADRVEFRDDRVIVFASASAQKQVFRYALRATTAGRFAAPPIEAACMYDAGYASIHGAGRVEVAR